MLIYERRYIIMKDNELFAYIWALIEKIIDAIKAIFAQAAAEAEEE